ncbi:F-box only protein 7 [Oopsacas minuta]|uniref:F-box only protein 7 n=1 Tax=Oopsacas minuta TaxID=111878 RepID=A0AAV7JZ35_9METZ|nr:F-box only protein 7 [Oopsacas minuta]
MKLRIKYNQSSFYISDVLPSTRFDQLKAIVSDRLTQEGLFLTDFDISLNGKTPLNPVEPSMCISDLGIVSGDAIKILTQVPTRTFDTSKDAMSTPCGFSYDVIREEMCNMGFNKYQIEFAIVNFPPGIVPNTSDLVNIILSNQELEGKMDVGRCEKPRINEREVECENINLQTMQAPPSNQPKPILAVNDTSINIEQFMADMCPSNSHQSLCIFLHLLMLKHNFRSVRPLTLPADSSNQIDTIKLEYKHEKLLPDTSIFVILVSVSPNLTNITICLDTAFTVSHTLMLSAFIDYHSADIFISPRRLTYELTRKLVSPLLKQIQELSGNKPAGLDRLCPELLLRILGFLDLHSLVSVSLVNHNINEMSHFPNIWRSLLTRDFPDVYVHGVMDYQRKYKQVYSEEKRAQKARKEREFILENDPVPSVYPPHGQFLPAPLHGPGHNPLIIGGSHDLDPFSGPGLPFSAPNNPLGGIRGGIRPRFDPVGPIPGMFPNPGREPRWGKEPPDGNIFGPYL